MSVVCKGEWTQATSRRKASDSREQNREKGRAEVEYVAAKSGGPVR